MRVMLNIFTSRLSFVCVCVCVVCLCNDDILAFVEGIEMYTFGLYMDDAVKESGSSCMFFFQME